MSPKKIILLSLNFEKRIWEHKDINVDQNFHFKFIDLHVFFCVKLVSSVRNSIPWCVSIMLYQITGSNIPLLAVIVFSLSPFHKMLNHILNTNAVEIVKVGCFHMPAMHNFLIILPSTNILVKLQKLLTCWNKALRSPSTGITRFPLQLGFRVVLAYTTGPSCSEATFFSNSIFTAKPIGVLIFSHWLLMFCNQILIKPLWNPFSVSRGLHLTCKYGKQRID